VAVIVIDRSSREYRLAYHRYYYEEHREELLSYYSRYHVEHREERAEKVRRRLKDPAVRAARARRQREKYRSEPEVYRVAYKMDIGLAEARRLLREAEERRCARDLRAGTRESRRSQEQSQSASPEVRHSAQT